jgi:hypothetical protein
LKNGCRNALRRLSPKFNFGKQRRLNRKCRACAQPTLSWHLADYTVLAKVRFAPILLQKSAVTDDVVRQVHFGAMGFAPHPDALYATFTLRNT